MQDYAVMCVQGNPALDAGFLEGGFCYILAPKAHVKFLKQRPLSIKTMPIIELYPSIDLFSIQISTKAC